ncbi:hypothetical protein D3C73_1513050 [compost metagenome]
MNVLHTCFLPELPCSSLLGGLIRPDEPSRQRPFAQEGMPSPLNEQNPELLIRQLAVIVLIRLSDREDDHVRRYRGTLIISCPILLQELSFR